MSIDQALEELASKLRTEADISMAAAFEICRLRSENESLRAEAMRLQDESGLRVLRSFEITGPDCDGEYWLILHGHGTTGQAMFRLSARRSFAVEVALALEHDRRAVLANKQGRSEVNT